MFQVPRTRRVDTDQRVDNVEASAEAEVADGVETTSQGSQGSQGSQENQENLLSRWIWMNYQVFMHNAAFVQDGKAWRLGCKWHENIKNC